MSWTETWRRAEVVENRPVARGTQLSTLRLPDDLPFPFEPGHVVALRMATPTGVHRHPYTVCGAEESTRELTFVYRVTKEGFFNWNAEPDAARVSALAEDLRRWL